MEHTRHLVRDYFAAWTAGELERARALLADDLSFEGSIDEFDTADDYVNELRGFMRLVDRVDLLAEFFGDGEAMLLYDCVTNTDAGVVTTAEHLRLRDGKVTAIRLVYDATRLRKVMAELRRSQ